MYRPITSQLNKVEQSINRTRQHLKAYYCRPSADTATPSLRSARCRSKRTLRHIDALLRLLRSDRAARRELGDDFLAKIFGLKKSALVLLAKLDSRHRTGDQDPSANDMLVDSGMLLTEIGSAMLDVPAHLANSDSSEDSSDSESEDAAFGGDHGGLGRWLDAFLEDVTLSYNVPNSSSLSDSSDSEMEDAADGVDHGGIGRLLDAFLEDVSFISYSVHQG